MYQNNCIENCPAGDKDVRGTTSVAGVCRECETPCQTCAGSPSICTLCDGSEGRKYFLNNTCYADCPLQYANDDKTETCIGCLSGCDRCNVTNITQCLRCGDKLFLYNDTCSGSCPEGWKGRDRVCINESDDLRVMYFPFLITAFILTIMVFFGKLKRKGVLKDGKKVMVSNQWSIVTIIALVSLV